MFGFTRAQRVRKRPEFIRIQASPVRISTKHLLFLLARGEPSGSAPSSPSRLGVVASRKVGGAVQRNRAKRLVREAFRLSPGVFPDGVDFVVIVRPGTHLLTLAEVADEVARAAAQIARRAAGLRR